MQGWCAGLGLLVTGMLLLAGACGGEAQPVPSGMPPGALGPLPTVEFSINGVPVTIEVAITPEEQRQGLMYRESMPENHGMLFVNEQPRFLSFWMKNTRIPLDIAYIREDLTIGNIETMQPHTGPFDPPGYRSRYRSLYALEMNAGWFDRNGVEAGDTLPLPLEQIEAMKSQR